MNNKLAIPEKINIFWFRRDLRLEDNTALFQALGGSHPVLPIFIFDTEILDHLNNRYDLRVNFIYQSLQRVENQLRKKGRGLLIYHGKPEPIWQQIISDYQIDTVYFNHDYEPYALDRDQRITALLTANGINVFSAKDQVIFEKSEIVKDDNMPYTVYTPYSKRWKTFLKLEHIKPLPSETMKDNFLSVSLPPFPSLELIGFQTGDILFPEPNIDEDKLTEYDKVRDFPAIDGTSRLSVHLRFGTISIRRLVREAIQLNETWLDELIWREFFMMILYHFPSVVNSPFKKKYANISWRNDIGEFERWCQGRTGYPLVDAGMRELNATGFMHNRVRMVTASFLTKHLLIDWRWGEKYFAQKLLDYDLSANNGNWQWAAGCGCDAAPYFRIFNPITQAEKFDPDQKYIKKWIPEFGTCDYPEKIVDHAMARERALSTYKMVL